MALEVKMKRDNNTDQISSSGSETVIKVLRGMLRTGYGFAKDIPEKVHIFAGIDHEDNSVSFEVLFSIDGNLYTPLNIDQSKADVEWDMSENRLTSLYQYLGNDLLNKIIPTLKVSLKEIPDSIQTSYDIEKDTQTTFFNYGTDNNMIRDEWKESLSYPENGLIMDMVKFDYLRIEEEF